VTRNQRIDALMKQVRVEFGERRLPERYIHDLAVRRYAAEVAGR
jgi:hypothetical protein